MAGAVYLADTTVFVLRERHASVDQRFAALLAEGRVAACQMVTLERLNNAANPRSYELIWSAMHRMRWLDVTTAAMDRALSVHHQLGAKSQHRHFRLADLIIAATAELGGATVLHYDADFDRIAAVTGQPTEWVAERGSL